MNNEMSSVQRPFWPVFAGGTGGLVWTQTSFGAFAELFVGTPHLGHLAATTLAGVVLVAGLAFRHAFTLLLAFPIALVVAFATMPPPMSAAALDAVRFLPWTINLVGYLMVTSVWLARRQPASPMVEVTPLAGEPTTTPTTLIRTLGALALLVIPMLAVVLQDPMAHFRPNAEAPLIFAHSALLFLWCLGLYTFFIGPMLDAERRRRMITRKGTARRVLWRASLAVAGALMLCLMLLFS